MSKEAIDFIREFDGEDKMVAAICHGPWTLIDADRHRQASNRLAQPEARPDECGGRVVR